MRKQSRLSVGKWTVCNAGAGGVHYRQPAVAVDVRIGEIDGQRRIVVAQIGDEQQGLDVVEHHLEPGEIACVGIEQPVRAAGGRAFLPARFGALAIAAIGSLEISRRLV